MGCNCNNGGASAQSDGYSQSMACEKCLAKHLSKAAVEYAEVLEDGSRYAELSMCIGDMACAEDHASALGLSPMRDRIRSVRGNVYSMDPTLARELGSLAAEAVGRVVSRNNTSVRFAMEMARKREEDSNDAGTP